MPISKICIFVLKHAIQNVDIIFLKTYFENVFYVVSKTLLDKWPQKS